MATLLNFFIRSGVKQGQKSKEHLLGLQRKESQRVAKRLSARSKLFYTFVIKLDIAILRSLDAMHINAIVRVERWYINRAA